MVRKRSKSSKKNTKSEDEERDTDEDFNEEEPKIKPKKYSLRQRKKFPTFNDDDFEYEDDLLGVDEESSKTKCDDDDEDFEVGKLKKERKTKKDLPKDERTVFSDEEIQKETNEKESSSIPDDLIDFEDIIRADIVMNRNRIDYDNVIQKTEIKVQVKDEQNKPKGEEEISKSEEQKNKSRRGRKPKKRRPSSDIDIDPTQFLAPQIQENDSDEEYHPYGYHKYKPKRQRKPKARPAGEIDSSLLDDYIEEYEFEDKQDTDYNPREDIEYPGLGLGLSSYILEKQIIDNYQGIVHTNSSSSISIPKPVTCRNNADSNTAGLSKLPSHEPVRKRSAPSTVKGQVEEKSSKIEPSVAATPTTEESKDDECRDDDSDDGTPRQLNEKNGTFEKVVVDETLNSDNNVDESVGLMMNSDNEKFINGKHIENPEINIVDCKDEIESEDDDIVFIETERTIIVLDD
ncbi:unnamed protein product [Phyllotreta striolata]|uniref:Uncharacterized protein n=1 Tax=Phyllotreta striolata TaxID=444603 RepID=A0A9N9TCS8_PHYSR|nr:unnamed protein product [Phyllotreta striolata]